MRIVAFVPDLMDRSRLAAAGADILFSPSAAQLVELVRQGGADLVVVDLARPGSLEAVAQLAAGGVPAIGFGSHVDRGRLDEAAAAGCTRVMTRSAFFRQLPQVLSAGADDGGLDPPG